MKTYTVLYAEDVPYDAAPQLLAVLQTFIARADDLIAAIEGVTDQFETEVAALSAAATQAEAAVKAAKGGAK